MSTLVIRDDRQPADNLLQLASVHETIYVLAEDASLGTISVPVYVVPMELPWNGPWRASLGKGKTLGDEIRWGKRQNTKVNHGRKLIFSGSTDAVT